ncbi:MAG: HAMP domain-containing histidine kinase [Clostridia bacterium]|nr:HAMP domain-containing histidine kinase [Clostridia bacterium]
MIILSLLCAALALRLFAVERNARAAVRQLRERAETDSSVRLRLDAPSAAAEELLIAVNQLLELRENEAAAYRSQERTIRQQIANVSHDLRTPLTSILGYLQLLEGDALSPEERKEYLDIVQGRAKSLQSLITGFYDLSRLEGGEYPLNREKVDLYGTLSSLVAEFYNDFIDRGFDMTVELQEGLPLIRADSGGVLRVFTNLIRNALEHGEKRLSIRLYKEGNALVTAFANDARDISGEDIDRVFERFYTADKMRTGQSTGLGLAIVRSLTARMGHGVSAKLQDGMFVIEVRWGLGT